MDNTALEKLERILRNLPITNPRMERVEGEFGVIYFGYGEAADGTPHGVWGSLDYGRTLEFEKGTSVDLVKQALVDDALGFIALCHEKGLLNGI